MKNKEEIKNREEIQAAIERIKRVKATLRPGSFLNDVAQGRLDALKWVIEQKN